jgi:uncharacterized protein YndB with AHSA1/START domain/catechol 2,3-dioxygenase-like lactoylglutathione lyase family enzyme
MEDDPLPQPPGSERAGTPAAVRSVTLSTPDLDASVAYLTAINGHGPEPIELHAPEHEALWGLQGAACKRAVFRSGDVLVEVVEYTSPVGKPWPPGYRICDQGILNVAYGARTKRDHGAVVERALAFGACPNWRPFHLGQAGVVYFNDPLGFSVEVLWMGPGASDRRYGFEPVPREKRPRPDPYAVEATVRIAAPAARVWQVLCDQEGMSRWAGFDSVRLIREGFHEPSGVGAERLLSGSAGVLVEQIVGFEPERQIRYRVIEGAPFHYHRGQIDLREEGGETEVRWRITFRGKVFGVGVLIRAGLQRMLERMLAQGLKPTVEGAAARR